MKLKIASKISKLSFKVFPAGILQKPFFSANQTDAENYGGIGAVIAHECTHGFDDSGKNYNYAGELKQWWSEKAKAIYESRTENWSFGENYF